MPRKKKTEEREMANCAINGCHNRHPNVCPLCVHWSPTRKSRYYYCNRFYVDRITCELPKMACKTCPFYEGKGTRGRPNNTGIDWSDNEQVKKYAQKKMAQMRKERYRAAHRRKYGVVQEFPRIKRSMLK